MLNDSKPTPVISAGPQGVSAEAPGSQQNAPKHSACRCVWHALGVIGATLTFIRNVVANLLFLLILAVLAVAWGLSSSVEDQLNSMAEGQTAAPAKPAPGLWLDLSGWLDEMPQADDSFSKMFARMQESASRSRRIGLEDLEALLKSAAADPEIKTVVADMSALTLTSTEQVLRLGRAFDEFRSAAGDDKELIVSAGSYTQGLYAAAAHASKVVLDPLGEIDLHGLSLSSLYFGGAVERFKLTPYVFRRGSHKSAVEPYERSGMSAEVKAEYQGIADTLWSELEKNVAAARPALKNGPLLPPAQTYLSMLEQARGDDATLALKRGLCDMLLTPEALKAMIAKEYPSKDDSAEPDAVSMDEYRALLRERESRIDSSSRLGVIYGEGVITSYDPDPRAFTPDNIGALLDRLSDDDHVKGALLVLSSGGGEFTASEEIRRSLEKFKKDGHKLVVYMADSAASGAYLAATAADRIVASPMTLTGSVGVFAAGLGADRLLNEYGVTQDGVVTSPFAVTPVAQPMPDEMKKLIDLQIGHTYDYFTDLVKKTRPLKSQDPQDFAEGRVFTAEQALKLGLIDEVGGYQEALAALERECGLKPDEAVVRPQALTIEDSLEGLPALLLKNFGSVLPEGLARELWQKALKAPAKASSRPEIYLINELKAEL